VPTPESAAAFAKLAGARARLTEITKELNEALARRFVSIEHGRRYAELQKAWDDAVKDLETATEEFSAAVRRLKKSIEPPNE
jgi:hypothetical protein